MNNTFLLIDDDTDDQEFFLEAVREVDSGIRCHLASSCDEALTLLNASPDPMPEIIFLDLNMPRVDGRRCLQEIKKLSACKDIPIVIYSTSSLKKDIDETLKMGAVHFLTKPSAFNQLCTAIAEIRSVDWKKKVKL